MTKKRKVSNPKVERAAEKQFERFLTSLANRNPRKSQRGARGNGSGEHGDDYGPDDMTESAFEDLAVFRNEVNGRAIDVFRRWNAIEKKNLPKVSCLEVKLSGDDVGLLRGFFFDASGSFLKERLSLLNLKDARPIAFEDTGMTSRDQRYQIPSAFTELLVSSCSSYFRPIRTHFHHLLPNLSLFFLDSSGAEALGLVSRRRHTKNVCHPQKVCTQRLGDHRTGSYRWGASDPGASL